MSAGRIPTTANSPLTVKGDLFTFSTGSAKLAVGADDTALVADSAQATGLAYKTKGVFNGLTTTGDTIYSSSGTTQSRLGIGSTGQVLTVAAGLPSWATVASSTPGTVQLAQTVLTSSAADITFSSISGSYKNLRLVIQAVTAGVGYDTMSIQFNGDTGANYDDQYIRAVGTTVQNDAEIAQTKGWICVASSSSGSTSGAATITIPNYSGTVLGKSWISNTGAGTIWVASVSGSWKNTAAITSMKIFGNVNNLGIGTCITLYGEL